MQVLVPSEYRQSARWLLNLDAGSFALLIGGASIGFEIFRGHAALGVRIPEALAVIGLGAVLALVKWPIDNGDRVTVWMMRAWSYYWRSRRGSAWGD